MNGFASTYTPKRKSEGSERYFGGRAYEDTLTIPRRRPPLPNSNAARKSGLLDSYPDVLNIGHVCEITGLSAQTVRQECSRGNLPAVRIGRRWFVTKSMFIDYLMGRGAYAQ